MAGMYDRQRHHKVAPLDLEDLPHDEVLRVGRIEVAPVPEIVSADVDLDMLEDISHLGAPALMDLEAAPGTAGQPHAGAAAPTEDGYYEPSELASDGLMEDEPGVHVELAAQSSSNSNTNNTKTIGN